MSTDTPAAAYLMTRRVRTSGSQGMALGFGFLGLLFLVFFWPLGLLLILIAFFADAKYGKAHYCGSCGNDVAPTSRLCPTCHSELIPGTHTSGTQYSTLRKAAIIFLTLVIVGVIVIVNTNPAKTQQTLGQRLRELENSPRGQQLKAEASAEYEAEQREKAEQQALIDAKVKAALDLVTPKGPPPAKFGN